MNKQESKGNKQGKAFEYEEMGINTVQVRCGAWIDGIGINGDKFGGGPGGGLKEFTIDQNDFITKVAIKYGSQHLGQIQIETYNGKTFIAGPNSGGGATHAHSYEFAVGKNQIINGFHGTSGQYLNSLGVVLRDIPAIGEMTF